MSISCGCNYNSPTYSGDYWWFNGEFHRSEDLKINENCRCKSCGKKLKHNLPRRLSLYKKPFERKKFLGFKDEEFIYVIPIEIHYFRKNCKEECGYNKSQIIKMRYNCDDDMQEEKEDEDQRIAGCMWHACCTQDDAFYYCEHCGDLLSIIQEMRLCVNLEENIHQQWKAAR